MQFSTNDYIRFAGVLILLIAFLLNLTGKISKVGLTYITMNAIGAGLACLASWLIHYIPFVILEGTWTFVSLIALFNYFRKNLINFEHWGTVASHSSMLRTVF